LEAYVQRLLRSLREDGAYREQDGGGDFIFPQAAEKICDELALHVPLRRRSELLAELRQLEEVSAGGHRLPGKVFEAAYIFLSIDLS